MDKQPLISVIVPVYKVEEYLNQCIDSIVSQTYRNLEIILVDDGSPDNCPKICDDWAEKDNRIKVLHLQNGGAGRARNVGYSVCTGEFISFVDSDDVLYSCFYKNMLCCFNDDVEIVECDYCLFETVLPPFIELDNPEKEEYDANMAMYGHISDSVFRQVIWNKLYKSSLWKNVRFPEGKYCEDVFAMHHIVSQCRKICLIPNIFCWYRLRLSSIMHEKYNEKHLDAVEALLARSSFFEKRQMYSEERIMLRSAIYRLSEAHERLKEQDRGKESVYACLSSICKKQCLISLRHGTDRRFINSMLPYMLGPGIYRRMLTIRNEIRNKR